MTQTQTLDGPQRLEDYIGLAKQGKKVKLRIDLRRVPVKQKVHREETDDMSDEIDTYLLMADYELTAQGKTRTISKVYVLAPRQESLAGAKISRSIATERLKMDYRRLREAGIKFEEKYF